MKIDIFHSINDVQEPLFFVTTIIYKIDKIKSGKTPAHLGESLMNSLP